MAYARKYRPRRKVYIKRKQSKTSKYMGYANTAVKALALASKVARMVNVEYKVAVTASNGAVADTGAIVDFSAAVTQGNGTNQRNGDSVKFINLVLRMFTTQHGSAQKTALRVIIFRGKQENAVAYTVADVIDTSLSTGTANDFLAPKKYSERFRTKVLYDNIFHMSNNGNSSLLFNKTIKLYGHCEYVTAGSTIENGGLYMLVISNEPTNTPTLNYVARLSFTDN